MIERLLASSNDPAPNRRLLIRQLTFMSHSFARCSRIGTMLSAALMLVAPACGAPTAPPAEFPARAIPWAAPVQYDLWWALTEACAGRQSALSDVQWYLWPDEGLIVFDGKSYDGYWWPSSSRILLAHAATDNGQVVRHEMLHQLLQLDGHPTEYFDQRCAGVVRGTGASSTVGADSALVARALYGVPELLAISLSTVPSRPRASVNGGWFVIDVQATNPSADPIWVPLDSFLDIGYKGLGYVVSDEGQGRTGGLDVAKEYRIFFAPGQRRHYYFDVHEPAPATFTVRGGISGRYSATATVVVDP